MKFIALMASAVSIYCATSLKVEPSNLKLHQEEEGSQND